MFKNHFYWRTNQYPATKKDFYILEEGENPSKVADKRPWRDSNRRERAHDV